VILVGTTKSISLFDDSTGTPEHLWSFNQNFKNRVFSNLKALNPSIDMIALGGADLSNYLLFRVFKMSHRNPYNIID
jgi:hypothetical protein